MWAASMSLITNYNVIGNGSFVSVMSQEYDISIQNELLYAFMTILIA
jgi:hypothetical protein